MFILLVAWFVLSHRYQRGGGDGDDFSSYYTGGRTDITAERRSEHHRGGGILAGLAATGIGVAALNALGRRRSQRTAAESEHRTEFTEASHHSHHDSRHSHSGSGSSFTDEKIAEHDRSHKWRNRLFAGAGLAAAAGIARNFIKGRKQEENVSAGSFSQASGPAYSDSRTDFSRMEEGRVPMTTTNERIRRTEETSEVPVAHASPSRRSRLQARRSGASIMSEETHSYASPGRDKRKNHTVRNSIAAMGIGAYLMNRFGRRRREEERVEELRERDEEAERIQRRNSLGGRGRYTGDNRVRRDSFSETDVTPYGDGTPSHSRHNLGRPAAAIGGAAAGAAVASAMHRGSRQDVVESIHSGAAHDLTPPPPRPYGGVHESSGSESFNSRGNRRHRHHMSKGEAAALAGAAGLAAGAAGATLAEHHRRRSSVGSPPLSLKMHTTDTNGRQRVTLRRLSPSEAALEREAARRRDRRGSHSSLGGGTGGMSEDDRWRRVEGRERAEAAHLPGGVPPPPPPPPPGEDARHHIPPGSIPPPPPAFHSSSPPYELARPPPIPGSVTGASATYDTGGSAAGSKADDNRRRRRAERARRAEQGRADGSGNRVNFT
jgi:hypothetical protein